MATPLGDIFLAFDGQGALLSLDWSQKGRDDYYSLKRYYGDDQQRQGDLPASLADPLKAYFEGQIDAIETMPVHLPGTDFQRSVWKALREIPAGTTCSYKDIACKIGNPKAMRAVGMANNSNPIAVVVPCHRVIGADGKMVGYGSGVPRKTWLLRHEGVDVPEQTALAL